MNLQASLLDYFVVAGAPLGMQICVIVSLLIVNIFCANRINKLMGRFTFSALFIYLNILYMLPYFISQTNGIAGFASAHGVSAYGFSAKMFSLYVFQLLIIPCILLGFFTPPVRMVCEAHFRSKLSFSVFVFSLAIYVWAYFVIVKPGIYHALNGDFQLAKQMRTAAVLGNTSSVSGVSRIFDYKNLVVWLSQGVILSYYLSSKRLIVSIIVVVFFIFLAAINFSKGAISGSLIMLLWAQSYKSNSLNYFSLLLVSITVIGVLVSYVYFLHPIGLRLDSAFLAIFRRIYNNSSSVYLQLNLFEHLVPNYLYIQDWGKIGDLIGLDPIIPKELVYQEFYSGEGQGGSTFMSEIYLAFGYAGFLLTPLFLLPIYFFDKFLHAFRYSRNYASNWVSGMLLFWGVIITFSIQASPFRIVNIFTILRLEYFAIAILVFLMVKIRVNKNEN